MLLTSGLFLNRKKDWSLKCRLLKPGMPSRVGAPLARHRNWVFIRGLVREQAHWHDFPELLKSRFPGDQVEFIDLPGNGLFFREKSPLKLEAYTDFMRARCGFLSEGKKISLF